MERTLMSHHHVLNSFTTFPDSSGSENDNNSDNSIGSGSRSGSERHDANMEVASQESKQGDGDATAAGSTTTAQKKQAAGDSIPRVGIPHEDEIKAVLHRYQEDPAVSFNVLDFHQAIYKYTREAFWAEYRKTYEIPDDIKREERFLFKLKRESQLYLVTNVYTQFLSSHFKENLFRYYRKTLSKVNCQARYNQFRQALKEKVDRLHTEKNNKGSSGGGGGINSNGSDAVLHAVRELSQSLRESHRKEIHRAVAPLLEKLNEMSAALATVSAAIDSINQQTTKRFKPAPPQSNEEKLHALEAHEKTLTFKRLPDWKKEKHYGRKFELKALIKREAEERSSIEK